MATAALPISADLSGTVFHDNGKEQGLMGADAGDYSHSSRLDLVVTTFDDDVPALFLNESAIGFSDVYLQAGLEFRTHQVGWGTAFRDLDIDRWQDISWSMVMFTPP